MIKLRLNHNLVIVLDNCGPVMMIQGHVSERLACLRRRSKSPKNEMIPEHLPARLVLWTVSQTITEQFINEDAERNWIHA